MFRQTYVADESLAAAVPGLSTAASKIAETWRVADGPPEGVDGGELGGLDLWPEATSESVFVVGRQQFAIQVIYPLSPDGRVFPCELLSIAEE